MKINRRTFLGTAGALVPAVAAARGGKMKNWAWIPTDTKKSADDWKRLFAKMRESGVSAILPEVYAGHGAHYASTRMPVLSNWLETLLPLAKAENLEVHAWMWAMPCMLEDVLKKHPDWYNVNVKGESAADKPPYVNYYHFLDPGRPEVREWVQGNVKELAGIPGLTGVHLDYIRHPDAILPKGLWKRYKIVQDHVFPEYDYGYTPYEREQFKKKYGTDPVDIKDGKLAETWLQFRCDMVTGLVNNYLVPAAKAGKKQISAAVFPGPSMARTHVRQDWGGWKLDAFLPMLYNSFYEAGPEWVGEETREGVRAVKNRLYAGLFVGALKGEDFGKTVRIARQAGAAGVALFAGGNMDEARWTALKAITAEG